MIKKEWRSLFKNKFMLAALAAIILIPSIYTTIFLGSMWDPYGKVDHLPVAIVNNDEAAEYNGKTLNIGEELVDSLKENNSLKFTFTNQESADEGLENGTYYMVISIPANFSQNATTLLSDNPEKMVLDYKTNPGASYIASKLSESALISIQNSISETVTKTYSEVIFEQLGRKRGAIWSLLLASGYLKTTRHEMDRRTGKREYFLKITNHESMLMFEEMIESWFAEEDSAYGNFKEALLAGDLDYMNQFMNQVALQSFSSFDSGTKPSENLEPERFYHGFVLGLIVDLAGKYHITSNRESGFGRYDVVMEPLQKQFDAIVMEFKVQNPAKEESLQHTVQNALLQIEEKNYDTELLARGIPKSKIRHYGFAFCGKKVLIGTDKSE